MGIDPEKLFVLFVIALIVLGPERLPRMARSLGRGLAELRKYTSAAQSELSNVLAEPREAVRSALAEVDLPDLSDLTSPLAPLRYIDAPSRPKPAAPPPSLGDGASWSLPATEASAGPAAAPAAAGSGAVGSLPDDPSFN
jgi:sec-independent protein translocase protein TatB